MNTIKSFTEFINENNSSNELIFTKNGDKLKINDVVIPMEKTTHIQSAFNQDTKSTFEADIYMVNYSELGGAIKKVGYSLKVLDKSGKTLLDGDGQGLSVVLYTPKNYNGSIPLEFSAYYVGKKSGNTRVTGKGETSWGIFDENLLNGLTEDKPVKANKAKISKKQIVPKIEINDGFVINTTDLTDNAKQELDKLKNSSSAYVTTGASKDYEGDNEEELSKDKNLVMGRYKALYAYLKSIGVKAKTYASKEDIQKGEKVYKVFTDDSKSENNRKITVSTDNFVK